MDGWTRADMDGLKRADERSKYLFLCSCVLTVLLTLIAIVISVLGPEIRYSLGLYTDSSQSEESAKPILAEMSAKADSIFHDASDRADKELKAQLELERVAREVAEREAREAREAEERAAVWRVTTIQNRTACDIEFQISNNDGTWKEMSIKAGENTFVWFKNSDIGVKYLSCVNYRLQENKYVMTAGQVVGHEPTLLEKQTAPVNYFWATSRQGVLMYKE
jgi:hypothetical protein